MNDNTMIQIDDLPPLTWGEFKELNPKSPHGEIQAALEKNGIFIEGASAAAGFIIRTIPT